ncbi:MAG: competence protein ComEC, partial [Miltoncostaeaceae bacterium]|nr:competence protein ComEC [Miltoncostaeaceae bacterium]
QGIAGTLRAAEVRIVGRRGGLRGLRDRWRLWAGGAAAAGLSGDRAALVRGMALGGGAGLSQQAAQAFRDSGLWHLLAVSGQNVAVVALAALAALRALGVGRRPAVGLAALLLVAYCLACDGGASVARAGVVGALGALAELRSAGRDRWHLLLVGLAALLAVQPRAIGDPGLQLSFAAVVGLFAIAPALEGPLRGLLPSRVASLAALAGGAGLATAPVLVWSFGRLSLAGLALNVVAVPLAAPVVVVALCGVAAGALLPAAGVALAWLAGLGAGLLLVMARAAAAIPGAAVELPAPAALPLAALAAGVPLLARWLRRPARQRPARASRGIRGRPLAIGALAALAALALAWPRGERPGWPSSATLTVLDVGQGEAVLLQAPDGSAALIDAGPPGNPPPVLAALRRAGVRRLAALAVSHGSLDHVGGAAAVVETLPVDALVRPPLAELPAAARRALRAARMRGTPVRTLAAGGEVAVGAWRLRALWPLAGAPAATDPNRGCLVLVASAGPLAALLPADAEGDLLGGLAIPPVDVLVVSHHGSDDPALPALLRRLRPALALISVGARNAYGHPAPATLDALAAAGVRVLRTDRSGDLGVSAGAGAARARAALGYDRRP